MNDRMLCCSVCDKPMLLMSPDQRARRDAHPEAYAYVCLPCSGEPGWPMDDYADAGG